MLLKHGAIIAFFTLLSRFFGLARELFIAAFFGTNIIADAVNVAFKLPNLFRRIFGEGALAAVFVPIYSEKLVNSKKRASLFSGKIFSLLLVILVALTTLMQLFMPLLMLIIAPGFALEPAKYELTIILCRITIPYVIFISITAFFGGMLNSVSKFAAFAFSPIIMNICIIIIPFLLQRQVAMHYGLAIALLIAGILQIIFMYYCILRAKIGFPLIFKPKDPEVKLLLKKMLPASLSSGAQQLNLFISQSIASFLPGAVSILSYADRLYQLPLSIIGVTFSTILLPELARIYKIKDYAKANLLQNRAIKIAAAISVPALFGLFILAKPIIFLIYQRGQFSAEDTYITANVLAAFALGLPAFILAKILMPIFYANLDTKTPLKISIYSLLINTGLNIILMSLFGHVGIALGSSLAAWFNIYLLYRPARNYGNFHITHATIIYIAKILIASSAMALFLLAALYNINFYAEEFTVKFVTLFATISSAILIFLLAAFLLKLHKL